MATFKIADVRAQAQQAQRVYNFSKSASTILNESVEAQTTTRIYDIFLSHSFGDADLILGVKQKLEYYGYSVYVDWIEDTQLNRSKVTRDTAETIRNRMDCCRSLFYTTTSSSAESKWMPWECGYMDGKKSKAAILPLTHTGLNSYDGQEYLGIYPYITEGNDEGGKRQLWVHESSSVYCPFATWLTGSQPRKH